MNWTERRERFRAILSGNRCVHPGSVYDAISARIAEDLGFEVGMFSGSIGSMSVLGAPDLVVLTLTEFAGQASPVRPVYNADQPITALKGTGIRTLGPPQKSGSSGGMGTVTEATRRSLETVTTLSTLVEAGIDKNLASQNRRFE
jgi:hypothetical protein